jgi:hypothetical protein
MLIAFLPFLGLAAVKFSNFMYNFFDFSMHYFCSSCPLFLLCAYFDNPINFLLPCEHFNNFHNYCIDLWIYCWSCKHILCIFCKFCNYLVPLCVFLKCFFALFCCHYALFCEPRAGVVFHFFFPPHPGTGYFDSMIKGGGRKLLVMFMTIPSIDWNVPGTMKIMEASAPIHATQWIVNASYSQLQRGLALLLRSEGWQG